MDTVYISKELLGLVWELAMKTLVIKDEECIGPSFNIGDLSFLMFQFNNYFTINKCQLLLWIFASFGRQ